MEEHLAQLFDPLAALMRWFETESLPAAVVGGVAASFRGKPRLTRDVDAIVYDIAAEALLATGAKFGFVPRIDDPIEFARTTRMLLLRHAPTGIGIDLSIGGLPFEKELVERSSWIDIGDGVHIRVASAEDIIIMKAIPRRARDIADIEHIIDANKHLDVERIRYWIREFSAILEMPEIYEDLERMLKRRTG